MSIQDIVTASSNASRLQRGAETAQRRHGSKPSKEVLPLAFHSFLLIMSPSFVSSLIQMFHYIRLDRQKHYKRRTMVAVDYLIKKRKMSTR
jgi:hypothetical protein